MLNIKNKQNYLKLFKYFVIIFLIFLLSSFLFKNSLYFYLIFIIISNIIFYILDKKNIYNLFFITVIISCILYIYSYNNIIEPQNKINKTCSQNDIDDICEYIASTREREYITATNKKQYEIDDDSEAASMRKAATKRAVIDGNELKKTKKTGSGDIPGMISKFVEDNKYENKEANKQYYIHEGRKLQLKSNRNINDRVRIWYDTYCNNINKSIKNWAGYTSYHLTNQAKKI
jgi:hypothetical protein